MKSWTLPNIVAAIAVLLAATLLYRNYDRRIAMRQLVADPYRAIKQYFVRSRAELTERGIAAGDDRPILWIHVPYEYNARRWESWGSRSSYQLNQPYLYLTVQSIIARCDQSFTICMIDDDSFAKLLPTWAINMGCISAPISDNMRTLGLVKLVHTFGGMLCPISFLCMRDLIGLYRMGTASNRMMVVDNVSRNINSTHNEFCPDITMFAAPPECPAVGRLCEYISRVSGTDFTAQSVFLGNFARWCKLEAEKGRGVTIMSAQYIGRQTSGHDGEREAAPILVEELMGNHYLDLNLARAYGIYVPLTEILNRHKYEWFARMSPRQILESDTMLGKQLMLANIPLGREHEDLLVVENFVGPRPRHWVGFWRTPLMPDGLYGQKPNFLGDNLLTVNRGGNSAAAGVAVLRP